MTRDAEQIAAKLEADISQGRKHARAVIKLNGLYVGTFGIRRGTQVGHDFIAKQICATTREALDLARCPLSKEDFTARLVKRGVIKAE